MTFMQRAVAVAARTARRASQPGGSVLRYMRAGETDLDLSETEWGLARRNDEQDTPEEQAAMRYIDQDFYLEIDSLSTWTDSMPREDDRIELTFGGQTKLYQVANIAPDPAARWSERYATHWRVHAQEITTP